MAITQKDIAQRLNLSIMTVSRALKGHPDINKDTRKLVLKTAREMNYTVNMVARSLVQKRTQSIGVLVPDISEPFFAEIVRGVEAVARENQYNILLADSDNDDQLELKALQTLLEKRVDGLIIGPTEKSKKYIGLLKNLSIPYVLINSNPVNLECDTIAIDRAYGARLAMGHLVECGYKQLYYMYSFRHMEQSRASIQGCYEALDVYGYPHNKLELLFCETHELETYYRKTMDNIRYSDQRIGIFVWDDEMAVGVYRALTEKGYDIPGQVGIVGFDDIKISQYLPKSLTTIRYPKYETGERAAERLMQCLASEEKIPVKNIEMGLQLIKRETTHAGDNDL